MLKSGDTKVVDACIYYTDKQEAIKVRKDAEMKYFSKYLDGLSVLVKKRGKGFG